MSGRQVRLQVQARLARLPAEKQRVLILGCMQRCYPFLARFVAQHPGCAPALPVIDRALARAWAGQGNAAPTDDRDAHELAATLRSLEPRDANGDLLTGDDSMLTLTYNLAEYFDLTGYPDLLSFVSATAGTAHNLAFQWYAWLLPGGGTTSSGEERENSSGCLYELAVLTRHVEWLERKPLMSQLVQQIRADSVRAGEELLRVVDSWRTGS